MYKYVLKLLLTITNFPRKKNLVILFIIKETIELKSVKEPTIRPAIGLVIEPVMKPAIRPIIKLESEKRVLIGPRMRFTDIEELLLS